MISPHNCSTRANALRFALLLVACALFVAATLAADPNRRVDFQIPAGPAIDTFKQFAAQSGTQLLYALDVVERVHTRPVNGTYTAREALTLMLEGTALVSTGTSNGAIAVNRAPDPNDQRAAPSDVRPVPTDSRVTSTRDPYRASSGPEDGSGREIIRLSPFVVDADEDQGYMAQSTLAGTRIRTNVRDIGSALTIVTKQFLEDTGAVRTEDLLVYTPNTEVGGISGNYAGTGIGNALNERAQMVEPNTNTRVRGLTSADNTRDYFLSDIPWDSYNVDRVELQRGPNSILYGLSKPGGLINASLKQAGYKELGSTEVRVGSFGTFRSALDLNRVLVDDQVALRINALYDDTKYRQEPAFQRDKRLYGALRIDPKFLNRGSAHTTVRVNYETGRVVSNRARMLPPTDRMTPWFQTGTTTIGTRTFNNLNQQVFDYRNALATFPGNPTSGFFSTSSPNYQPAISGYIGGNYAFFDSNGQTIGNAYLSPQTTFTEMFGIAPNGNIDGTINGLFDFGLRMVAPRTEIATRTGIPFATDYKVQSITDPSIFDFYTNLIDGPNKYEERAFDALNAVVSQTFFNNRAGVELSYDHQRYQALSDNILFGASTGDVAIMPDINSHLLDGSPNPNVGRPVVFQRSINGGNEAVTRRESIHATAFAELNAKDILGDGRLGRALGRHIITGAASESRHDRDTRNFASYAIDVVEDPLIAQQFNQRRELQLVYYLGGDMRGRASPSGLNLSRVQSTLVPTAANLYAFDSRWNRPTSPSAAGYVNPAAPWVNPFNNQTLTQSENPANYVGWRNIPIKTLNAREGDRDALTASAAKSRSETRSQVLVWQGYFLEDHVVTTFGYRRDEADAYNVTGPIHPTAAYVLFDSPSFVLPGEPNNSVSGTTKTGSIVAHAPKFIKRHLPLGMDVSLFYNQSENFEPAANRVDILNQPIDPPIGKTKDFGAVISLFGNKLTFKANRYESSAAGATTTVPSASFLTTIERRTWISAKRYEAGLTGNPTFEGPDYNYGTMVNNVFVQTAADRALQQQHVNLVLGAFAPEIWGAWNGMEATEAAWRAGSAIGGPTTLPNLATTSDTVSKGWEFELHYRPAPNWDIAVNASKTDAVRNNIAGGVTGAWIEARNAVWNGPAGQMRTTGAGVATYAEQWNSAFFNGYSLLKLLEGGMTPEIRPWRFNVITNYRFRTGLLRGVNIGGAARWEDKLAIGFPSITTTINGVTSNTYDIADPFWGPDDLTFDFWAGYRRKLTEKIDWKVQLNVRNALSDRKLIPINSQPDGGPAAFRIKDGTTWTVTNTFSF